MRILSLNIRGLGGLTKQKSLRHLFLSLAPDVVLLQETMTSSYPAPGSLCLLQTLPWVGILCTGFCGNFGGNPLGMEPEGT